MNGPVKKNTKIVAVNSKIATDFLVIAILKKTGLQEVTVPFRERGQNSAHVLDVLLALHQFLQIQLFISNVSRFKVVMLIAKIQAPAFRKNVLANSVNVSAETTSIIHTARLHGQKHAAESFLAHIFIVWASMPRARRVIRRRSLKYATKCASVAESRAPRRRRYSSSKV